MEIGVLSLRIHNSAVKFNCFAIANSLILFQSPRSVCLLTRSHHHLQDMKRQIQHNFHNSIPLRPFHSLFREARLEIFLSSNKFNQIYLSTLSKTSLIIAFRFVSERVLIKEIYQRLPRVCKANFRMILHFLNDPYTTQSHSNADPQNLQSNWMSKYF